MGPSVDEQVLLEMTKEISSLGGIYLEKDSNSVTLSSGINNCN
jgi:hypothetical protein